MKKLLIAMAIVSLGLLTTGCSEEDMEDAGDAFKDVAGKMGDAIEDTTKTLGDNMQEGKDRIRDAAEEIENE